MATESGTCLTQTQIGSPTVRPGASSACPSVPSWRGDRVTDEPLKRLRLQSRVQRNPDAATRAPVLVVAWVRF